MRQYARRTLKRGATISMALDLLKGDVIDVAEVKSQLRKITEESSLDEITYADGEPIEASVTLDEENSKWSIFYSSNKTLVDTGLYAMDVRVVSGQAVIFTETVIIDIEGSVTRDN